MCVYILPDPPGIPALKLDKDIWLENQTYTSSCNSSQGNPNNNYIWLLDNVNVPGGSKSTIIARKGQRNLRCNVTNQFTEHRGIALSDYKSLVVHCKINIIYHKFILIL